MAGSPGASAAPRGPAGSPWGGALAGLGRRVDAVAYTRGPGLTGALLVGKVAAQTLARAHGLPLVGVNHLEAHALAMGLVRRVPAPFLALIVSGGHTDLVLVRRPGSYRVLGRTRDDAAGEAFDKVAKLLGLGYPGGPVIDRLARAGNRSAEPFPRPALAGSWDFSFSGLKTAVLYRVRDSGYAADIGPARDAARGERPRRRPPRRFCADLAASFQEAVVETLADKALAAARACRVRDIVVGGGVAANSRLREVFAERAARARLRAHFPPPSLCTDNAAMVAFAGGLRLARGAAPRSGSVDPALPFRSWA